MNKDDENVPESGLSVGVFLDDGTIEFENMDLEDFFGLMQQLLGDD